MRTSFFALMCYLFLLPLIFSIPSRAQQDTTANSQNNDTIEGTVVSSSRDILVLRGDNGEYHLFTYDPATRPAGLTRGARVRVNAGAPDENGTRIATNIALKKRTKTRYVRGGTGLAATLEELPATVSRGTIVREEQCHLRPLLGYFAMLATECSVEEHSLLL